MRQEPDKDWLLTEQYHDSSRLTARATLHARFSANTQRKLPWIFDHVQTPPDARILELGCGPGWLWLSNRERIPSGWDITLTDFSPGMIEEAQRNLASVAHPFQFQVANAQTLPFPDGHFDGVIANNMLYHLSDIPAALAEVRRVLKAGGHFYASTLSSDYMCELAAFLPTPRASFARRLPFNLENGADLLVTRFNHVTSYRYENTLVVTETEPLIACVISMTPASASEMHVRIRAGLVPRLQAYFAMHGALRLNADAGLFEAW